MSSIDPHGSDPGGPCGVNGCPCLMTPNGIAVCPDDDPLTTEHPACPVCFLTHPEGACDR